MVSSLVAITTAASAQVRFSVEMAGKSVGTASLTQKLQPDGGKIVELKMELKIGTQKLAIRSQNTYDAAGAPIRKFLDSNIPGGALQKQIVTTFDGRGANVVILDGGKRTTRSIPLVDTAPRKNGSEFWFLRDRPQSGAAIKCYTFNMDRLAWELQTFVYRGKKSVPLGGKSVIAHEISTDGDRPSKAYVDDSGLPILIESGPTVLKRI